MRELDGPEALMAAAGEEFGVSRWVTLSAREAELFASSTGQLRPDGNLPRELLVARMASLMMELFGVRGRKFGLNYGIDDVRFQREVATGSDVRVHLVLEQCSARDGGVIDAEWRLDIEARGLGRVGTFVARTRYVFE
ncbi:hypothetical protein [Agromyces sp. NPDC049794]|uniref:hypothetical protein n=1 Tax=unclassified Agromyces TaxID=2639701 RepID=UPI0033C5E031